MQFTTLSTFTTLALATFVAAGSSSPSNQCNTGSIQCCNSVESTSTPGVASILALVGIDVKSVTGQVGLTCSAVNVVGVSGNSCSQQAACCTNNSFNGVVALGCSPINL